MSSPRPQSSGFQMAHSNTSQTHVDSPLRKASFPADVPGQKEFESTLSRSLHAPSDTALESEVDDDDVIHVNTARRSSRIYGGDVLLESTEELGTHDEVAEETTYEEGYGAPILASDEVAKEPFGYDLQPAVSPLHERRSSQDHGFYQQMSVSQTSLSGSRPSSRPGSIHGNMSGFHLPSNSMKLEDLEEYEPLFPEDEKNAAKQKPLTAADRLKRPELKNRKFPSQDVWEDTPNSLQYTATVSTPQLPEEHEASKELEETPEQAFARRQEELAEAESSGADSFLGQEKKKKPWADKSHLVSETRPNLKQQRFPSRDIWEDTPDSLQLQTTVAGPQSPDALATPEERPTTGAVAYHQEKAAAGIPLGEEEGRATTGIAALMKPSIPARPAKSKLSQSPDKAQPAVPDRTSKKSSADNTSPPLPIKTKPQIPARPSKPITRDSGESVPLTQVASNSSAKSVGSDQGATAAAKPKPPVPSRPVGSKIAALQGGFMADLNKRLQLGAQPPKKEDVVADEPEEVKEKAPLSDARKGRARGPARRAPAKSPAPLAGDITGKSTVLGLSTCHTVWHIDPEEDVLLVDAQEEALKPDVFKSEENSKAAEADLPTLATNTAGQSLTDIPGADKASLPAEESSVIEAANAETVEEAVTAVGIDDEVEKVSGEQKLVGESAEAEKRVEGVKAETVEAETVE